MNGERDTHTISFASLGELSDILADSDEVRGITAEEAAELDDDAIVCWCNNVTAGEIRAVISDGTANSLESVQRCTRATGGCGKCLGTVRAVVSCALHAE
ncbi:hypothetical protein GCM10010401_05580 [Rarobacter faecitabidus]|uniref:BFD-like [2Fe-2S] binding protein n=1 Tax=Rarobacter faecitabidus TaxID=13243 RepID=A0A542ZTL6_RARFA|nr:(2Fe-2S)-binding protein [Rarobacter faecitabidus]TQL63691.1 BFD-like [2Fe-2S] binding protein [Rarobacter faecitabidus]